MSFSNTALIASFTGIKETSSLKYNKNNDLAIGYFNYEKEELIFLLVLHDCHKLFNMAHSKEPLQL